MKFINKQTIAAFTLGALMFSGIGVGAASLIYYNNDVKVKVDGKELSTIVVTADNKNYVSARDIAETMGGTVDWDGQANTVNIETPKTDVEKVAKQCKDSCVMVYAYLPNGSYNQGSGFFYGGKIITCQHVIKDATKIVAYLDNAKYGCTVKPIEISTSLDIAVLEGRFGPIKDVKIGDSDKLKEGEKLLSITSPKACQNSIDECLYCGPFYDKNGGPYLRISESSMDAGSSGGAVFNLKGELIGVNIGGEREANANTVYQINDLQSIFEQLNN